MNVMRYRFAVQILLGFWLGFGSAICGAGQGGYRHVALAEPGWAQWRGPRRDGISDENGLLAEWPKDGPKLIWQAGNLGRGYSAPIITGGRIYLTGDVGDELWIFALDMEGRVLWQTANGRSWKGPYPGSRAACIVHGGRLYNMNAHGRLVCLDARTGKELWSANVLDQFEARNIEWAISECPVVDGGKVLVTAGGAKALMAAFDAVSGKLLWTTPPLLLGPSKSPNFGRVSEPEGEADPPSYVSPLLFSLNGRRVAAGCSQRHGFGVDVETGQLLWTFPIKTRYKVIAGTPVLAGDAIFVTAPDTEDRGLYRLRSENGAVQVEKLWQGELDTCHGGQVAIDGRLYGSYYRRQKGWACLDLKNGQTLYETRELAMGSVLYADGRLYVLSQEGEAALLKPGESGFEIVGRFRLTPNRVNDAWTHPVIWEGRLYLRYHESLRCFDVKRR